MHRNVDKIVATHHGFQFSHGHNNLRTIHRLHMACAANQSIPIGERFHHIVVEVCGIQPQTSDGRVEAQQRMQEKESNLWVGSQVVQPRSLYGVHRNISRDEQLEPTEENVK